MNPTSPTSAMSQGATFMRPGAMAWGHPGWASQPPADPATPVTIEHALAAAAKDPDQVTDLLDELSRGRLWLPLPEARPVTDGTPVRVGRPPADPLPLLSEVRTALSAIPGARQASRAWLSVSGQGEGLVISVTLDDPASQDAHQEVLDAVQRAVAAVPAQGFPIDVTFPGENEPDQVDAWISAYAEPFYIRA